ncbi:MAG TPA: DUF2231 domain-containing protein [Abditibacteriaceae bacterium]|jgi:uncharacterized membrane protein/cytochrome c5
MFLSWPELHGALTHFPIALLVMATAFEFGALLTKKDHLRNDWRTVSFWMMCGAVLMSVPTLLTGYITGQTLFSGPASPPQIFTWHWRAAVATSVLATLIVAWRVKRRDQLSRAARSGLLACLLVTVAFVATTGFLGGKMVFGDETAVEAPNSVGDINEPDEKRRDAGQDETSTRNEPQPDAQLVTTGKKLYEESRCQNCHRIAGEGRANGPDLTKVGQRLPDINWHIEHLKDPQSLRPDSTMPSYEELSADQLKALSAYLISLK